MYNGEYIPRVYNGWYIPRVVRVYYTQGGKGVLYPGWYHGGIPTYPGWYHGGYPYIYPGGV